MVLRSKGCGDVVGSVGSRGSSLRAGSSTVWMGGGGRKKPSMYVGREEWRTKGNCRCDEVRSKPRVTEGMKDAMS